MRGIPYTLPRFVYENARDRFWDIETRVMIAVFRADLSSRGRLVAVAYREQDDEALLITIHPLKASQLKNRTASGRWKRISS